MGKRSIELTSNRMSRGRRDVGTMPSGEEEGAASGVAGGSSVTGAASGYSGEVGEPRGALR